MFEEVFNEAKSAFIDGNYKIAEPLLNQMILKNSRNPEIYQMLATIFYDKGQFNKAIRTFKRVLEIDPTYTDASVGLSIILNDLGRYDEGRKVFDEAKSLLDRKQGKLDPHFEERIASKHEELADLYFQCKCYKESLEQLLKAQNLSSRKADLSLRIAECYIQMDEPEKAIQDLTKLLRDYPDFVPARLKLGIIHYNLSNLAEATEQFENVLLYDPQHSEAKRMLRMAQTAGITTLQL